jgi:hypothetical protein
MDKNIVLEMKDNKDIVISVNNQEKLSIKNNSRKIKAEDIFDLLDYSIGDSFNINIVNINNLDAPVVDFFGELLKDITNKLMEGENEDVDMEEENELDEQEDEFGF